MSADSRAFVGWTTLREDVELLSTKNSCRLEVVQLELTVPYEKKMMDLATVLLCQGFKVTLNSRTHMTAVAGKNDTRVYQVRVRQA